MKKIIISGGHGFLGRALALKFKKKYKIVVIDRESNDETQGDVIYRWDMAKLEDEQLKQLESEIKSCDVFIHFAASVGVSKINDDPKKAIRDDHAISSYLFPLLEKYKKKIIFSSTSEVYGNRENCTEGDVLQIGDPEILRWGYAAHKLMSEFLIKAHNLEHTIIRPFNITGKGQTHRYGMVLPTFIHKAKNAKAIEVFGNGNQTRSFCDIRDFVNVLELIIEENLFNNETINIGSDENFITINELATLLKEYYYPELIINYREFKEVYSNSMDDIIYRSPNIDKLKKHYQPQFSIQDIIKSML
ncbi:SDR family oxidoreductase [Halobacteriovorax sp. GB3]|uniref:NAD-dependent epimerase/dehydratase family protein n=1 Tax=Halobacteriovorax sp. GB3 TaxID=2719615 RepID=UPI00235E7D7A|nr:SDR family oxidoreductase [Halobacteriovorax sp. GB3]MDD0854359.1 SDR family oxidoreductase [Halobacteriovorax sp. GB3]